MTKREPKQKLQVPTRAPRAKGDMFQNLRRPEEVESISVEELVAPADVAPSPPTTHHPPPTTHLPPTTRPVAPERDFMRVPNSVVRDALPAGYFKGESKKTYDALYQRTRGAIMPRRTVRATLAEVMAWADVSHNTLKAHLKHLARVGLVRVHYVRGDNTGAEYEILTPEEAPPTTHHPPATHQPPTSQNLAPPTSQNLVLGGGGQLVEDKGLAEADKTSFKTNTEKNDDEAFALLLARLRKAVKDLTGKEPSVADAARWGELAELLDAELRIAAGRTGSISSVPAFFTEHLRRRLWKKERRQLDEEGKSAVGSNFLDANADASKCPDCFGTGMWYPEGFEKGVARCRHEKLLAERPKQSD